MEGASSFCRLCASVTPNQHLCNFDSVLRESGELIAAVQRIHPSICRGDALPQMVCKPCVRRVRMLAKFIKEVEDAQVFLAKFIASQQAIKQEVPLDRDDHLEVCSELEESNLNQTVKEEVIVKVKEELNIEEFEAPNDIIISVDIKSETLKNVAEKSIPSQMFNYATESPCGSYKVRNNQIIGELNKKIYKYQKVNESEDLLKKRSSYYFADLKIMDLPDPHWSDFWCCFRCDKKYTTIYDLREHSIATHGLCVVFKCSICPKRLRKFNGFLMHMKTHCEPLERCCEYCNMTFDCKSDVIQHKRLEHVNEIKMYRCVKCGLEFDYAIDLKCHRDSFTRVIVVNPQHRKYICDNCGKVCTMKSHLAIHMMLHYPNRYRCKICNKDFRQKNTLVQHETNIHGSGNQHICPICGKAFKSSFNMKSHVDIHMGVKPHSCDVCEKTFRTLTQLKSHQLSHGGPLLHACQICGKCFRYKSTLKNHKNIHTVVKPYNCETCLKEFSDWSNFNKHMKRIHGKNMAKKKVKKDDNM